MAQITQLGRLELGLEPRQPLCWTARAGRCCQVRPHRGEESPTPVAGPWNAIEENPLRLVSPSTCRPHVLAGGTVAQAKGLDAERSLRDNPEVPGEGCRAWPCGVSSGKALALSEPLWRTCSSLHWEWHTCGIRVPNDWGAQAFVSSQEAQPYFLPPTGGQLGTELLRAFGEKAFFSGPFPSPSGLFL